MSKSILVSEYNNANDKKIVKKAFYQNIDISFLDILAQNEVEVLIKDYKDCNCKESVNLKDYFIKCEKCHATGKLIINEHEVTCNECHGEKYIRIHDCYVCNNEGKVLLDSKFKIKLNDKLKQDDELVYDFDYYTLVLRLNIYDKDEYLIKGNDIYKLKSIKYSKTDFKNKVAKEIKTIKNKEYLKSEFKRKKEVRRIENGGIDNGDFYFIFENEVDNDKEVIYSNVLIDKTGYLDITSLVSNKYSVAKKVIALNEINHVLIDETTKEIETDEYLIKLNLLDSKCFEIEDDKIVYVLNLKKEDMEEDKKGIVINNEKINVNFKKNLREVMYVNVANKVVVDKQGKKTDLLIKINPYFENIYKISIKKNKGIIYVDDYKYKDYRLVETFKKGDYLDNYLKIEDEEKVYVNDDVVLIKRV